MATLGAIGAFALPQYMPELATTLGLVPPTVDAADGEEEEGEGEAKAAPSPVKATRKPPPPRTSKRTSNLPAAAPASAGAKKPSYRTHARVSSTDEEEAKGLCATAGEEAAAPPTEPAKPAKRPAKAKASSRPARRVAPVEAAEEPMTAPKKGVRKAGPARTLTMD